MKLEGDNWIYKERGKNLVHNLYHSELDEFYKEAHE